MVIRVEYDRFNRYNLCIRTTGNRPSHAVAQGANFSIGARPLSPPLAPALPVFTFTSKGREGRKEGREGRGSREAEGRGSEGEGGER